MLAAIVIATLSVTGGRAGAITPNVAHAATEGTPVYVEGHWVGLSLPGDADTFDMVRTAPGAYDTIGVVQHDGESGYGYFKRPAGATSFTGGVIGGTTEPFGTEEGPAAKITRSPNGQEIYAAVQQSCGDANGGIYVMAKTAAAANFPDLTTADRAATDSDCDNPLRLEGIAALSRGRVAVLALNDVPGLRLLIGTPGGRFSAVDLGAHINDDSDRAFITRDPDTGEVAIAMEGERNTSPHRSGALAWTYRTDNTVHGPTLLPTDTPSGESEDLAAGLTAADGQVWFGVERRHVGDVVSKLGSSSPGHGPGIYVIHRNAKRHWSAPYRPSGDSELIGLAAVPGTGVLHLLSNDGFANTAIIHLKRDAAGHWSRPAKLPKHHEALDVVSTNGGGYRYAYIK